MAIYPDAIPTIEEVFDYTDDVDWMTEDKWDVMRNELIAIATELGTLPKGEYATVKDRLDDIVVGDVAKIQDADEDTSVDTEPTEDADEIVSKVANVEAKRIHDNGIVDFPKQSGCSAHLDTNTNINNNTHTKVPYDTKLWDIQNEFDSTINFRFTATEAGKYLITVIADIDDLDDADRGMLIIRVNNVAVYLTSLYMSGAAQYWEQTFSGIVNLSANDYVEIFLWHDQGATQVMRGIKEVNRLSIVKVQ